MKDKTIKYLRSAADKTEILLTKAIEVKSKLDKAKTSTAKEIYTKKLEKLVKKLEPYMKLFNDVNQLTALKREQEKSKTEGEE